MPPNYTPPPHSDPKKDYCPNVTKITNPVDLNVASQTLYLDLFSPRRNFSDFYQVTLPNAPEEPVGFGRNDRSYSAQTDLALKNHNCEEAEGYTDYNEHPKDWQSINEWPVELAIVPVDIIAAGQRQQAIDICIEQRIVYNQQMFIKQWEADGVPPELETAEDAKQGPAPCDPLGEHGPRQDCKFPDNHFRPPCTTQWPGKQNLKALARRKSAFKLAPASLLCRLCRITW